MCLPFSRDPGRFYKELGTNKERHAIGVPFLVLD